MKNQKPDAMILWAIDIFSNETKLQKEAAWAIKALGNKISFQVQPVYVVVEPANNQALAITEDGYITLHKKAQDKFNQMIKGIKLKSVLPLAILEVRKHSVRDQISAILGYAQEMKAEMIVASTRANQGPARWFLGSFVESLSLRSQIPLLIVNPSWKRRPMFKNILFPTDFSPESYEAFHKVLSFAKMTGSQILIFHKLVSEVVPVWTSGFGWIPPNWDEKIEKEEINKLKEKAKKWTQEAKSQGIIARSEIEISGNYSVAEAIMKKCKTGPYLIAMGSRSGAIEASLLGSVTRQLMRQACNPIWIIHPSIQEGKVIRFNLEHEVRAIPIDRGVKRTL